MLQAPAEHAERKVRCPHCRQVVRVPRSDAPLTRGPAVGPAPLLPPPASPPRPAAEPVALSALYVIALLIGVTAAGFIYLVSFDEFSEEELVTVTPLWFFPVVFGLYGLVSQRLLRRAADGHGTDGRLTRATVRVAGPVAGLMLLPFLAVKWRSSLMVSLVAAVVWALLLWLFFAVVFPSL
ncbi:hypothetical protein GCM10018783_18920 [Streptomyces griseosporeus]|nr:hypothetical protein GCM10018783_18920 [Streptomyces griseosporeus]